MTGNTDNDAFIYTALAVAGAIVAGLIVVLILRGMSVYWLGVPASVFVLGSLFILSRL